MEKKSSPRLDLLKKYLADAPGDPFLLFAVAKEYEKLEEKDSALSYYLRLKQEDPTYVGTYYHLGKLYESKGEIENAFFTYKAGMVVAKNAGDQKSLEEIAGAKLALGDDDDFE
ncbi:MAG: tetratricopeptide repeat protein [Bacteroidota bacterium]